MVVLTILTTASVAVSTLGSGRSSIEIDPGPPYISAFIVWFVALFGLFLLVPGAMPSNNCSSRSCTTALPPPIGNPFQIAPPHPHGRVRSSEHKTQACRQLVCALPAPALRPRQRCAATLRLLCRGPGCRLPVNPRIAQCVHSTRNHNLTEVPDLPPRPDQVRYCERYIGSAQAAPAAQVLSRWQSRRLTVPQALRDPLKHTQRRFPRREGPHPVLPPGLR